MSTRGVSFILVSWLSALCACANTSPESMRDSSLIDTPEEVPSEPVTTTRYYCTDSTSWECIQVRLQDVNVIVGMTRELCQEGAIDACIDLGPFDPLTGGPEWYTLVRDYCERGHARSCKALYVSFTVFEDHTLADLHLARAWYQKYASSRTQHVTSGWSWSEPSVSSFNEQYRQSIVAQVYVRSIQKESFDKQRAAWSAIGSKPCDFIEKAHFPYHCKETWSGERGDVNRLSLADPYRDLREQELDCERQVGTYFCMRLAHKYVTSSRFIEADALKARYYFRRACNEGSIEGCFEFAKTFDEVIPEQFARRFEVYDDVERTARPADVISLTSLLLEAHHAERVWALNALEKLCVGGRVSKACDVLTEADHKLDVSSHEQRARPSRRVAHEPLQVEHKSAWSVSEMQQALRRATYLRDVYRPTVEQEENFAACSAKNQDACIDVLRAYHTRPRELDVAMEWVEDRASWDPYHYRVNFSFRVFVGAAKLSLPDSILLDHLLPYCDSRERHTNEHDVIACAFIGELAVTGTRIAPRYKAVGLAMMRHGCFDEEYGACERVAKLFEDNEHGIAADPDSFDLWMLRGCQAELWESQCMAPGLGYLRGSATHPPDSPRARRYFRGACRVGYGDACLFLADGESHGLWSSTPDEAQRFDWIERACLLGRGVGCEQLVRISRQDEIDATRRTRIRDTLKFACRHRVEEACQFFSEKKE